MLVYSQPKNIYRQVFNRSIEQSSLAFPPPPIPRENRWFPHWNKLKTALQRFFLLRLLTFPRRIGANSASPPRWPFRSCGSWRPRRNEQRKARCFQTGRRRWTTWCRNCGSRTRWDSRMWVRRDWMYMSNEDGCGGWIKWVLFQYYLFVWFNKGE